ncbi:hypothetical protein [Pendulispora albinea]|uniref:Uncharacterized protein n=1 Tax=Pendulispora albinea TaxID=2741071 RepID=A0ABZ2LRB1_9BACT
MRLRSFHFFLLAISTTALLALAVACSTTSGGYLYYPTRGIQVRADSITQGKGCGTAPTQVYKYVAVVSDADGMVRAASLNDCFADAVFQQLAPSADGGFYNFYVDVYAFNAADYAKPQRALADGGAGGTVADVVAEIATGDGAADHRGDRHWAGRTLKLTWETDCAAVQEAGVEVIAVCKPLVNAGSNATIQLPTAAFPGTEGGFSCDSDTKKKGAFTLVRASLRGLKPPPPSGDGGTEDAGNTDAGDASADAGDAGADAGNTPDASPPPVLGAFEGTCPKPIVMDRVPAPADHVLDVELLQRPEDGGPPMSKGRAVCRASTKLYESVTAQCEPAPTP